MYMYVQYIIHFNKKIVHEYLEVTLNMKYCTVTFPVNTYTLSDLELICNAVRFCFMNYCSFKMTNSYTCYPLLNIFINLGIWMDLNL